MRKDLIVAVVFATTLAIVSAATFAFVLHVRQGPLDPPGYVNMRGQIAPAFTETALNGMQFSTLHLQRPLVVEFFASWCPACQGEIPEMNRLARELHGSADVVAITADKKGQHQMPETVADLRDFIHRYAVRYPIAFDPHASIAQAYHVGSFPQIAVIRQDGVVEYNMAGGLPASLVEQAIRFAQADVGKPVSGRLNLAM